MLIIRLARHGRKKSPFYHLVVAEKARAVQKKYVERIGHYNPLADGGKGELVFDQEKVAFYIGNGAQMSQTAARLLSKAGCKEAGNFSLTAEMASGVRAVTKTRFPIAIW